MLVDGFQAERTRTALRGILERLQARSELEYELSLAVLDSKCELIAFLGGNLLHAASFEVTLQSLRKYFNPKHGEVFITNDPYIGNTRLCDLLLLQGAFGTQTANELRYYVAVQVQIPQLLNTKWGENLFTSIEEEGYRIPPTPLDQNGVVNPALVQYLTTSGIPEATLSSVFGRLKYALKMATQELTELEKGQGRDQLARSIADLKKYSEGVMRKALHEIPDGEYLNHDYLDNDGYGQNPVRIQCKVVVQGANILVSFQGTSKQVKGPYNSNYAMTLAACFAFFRKFARKILPVNSGAFKAFSIEAPSGTVVNANYPSAMLGGYFETSYRICDSLLLALSKALPLEVPSQSCGTSSPVIFRFGSKILHETLGGGTGGGQLWARGTDAVKPLFDNSPTHSVEYLEKNFPIQLLQNNLRDASEGNGRSLGGRGVTRGYKLLQSADLILLGDRKHFKPQGLYGGTAGLGLEVTIIKGGQKKKLVCEKGIVKLEAGDMVFINTPGGGGWGKPEVTE